MENRDKEYFYEQADELLALENNWDGYGAVTINPEAVDAAKDMISGLDFDVVSNIWVGPTVNGGIQLQWKINKVEYEFDIKFTPETVAGVSYHYLEVEGLIEDMDKTTKPE